MFLSLNSPRKEPEEVKYPGKPLQSHEIRVVKLQPGRWTDPIVCELTNDALEHAKYKALSYVWGSQHVKRPIRLDGRLWHVTKNLESALRHLRERYSDGLVLWVDALCINQQDMPGRTHQVQLVKKIYTSCSECIVYLGDRLEGDPPPTAPPAIVRAGDGRQCPREDWTDSCRMSGVHQVFSFFQELSQSKHLSEVVGFKGMTSEGNDTTRLQLFEALRRFRHPPFTPWWSRVWVIQEVSAPRQITITYGTNSAPWSMFATAALQFKFHSIACCAATFDKLPLDESKVLTECWSKISDIEELRPVQHHHRIQVELRSLQDMLIYFRDRKATDPKDKVYALLGLVRPPQARQPMIPDYSLSDVEVYRQATLESIYTSEDLSVFSTDLGRKFRNDLPSWVPDWSAPGGQTYRGRVEAVKLYRGSPVAATPAAVKPLDDVSLAVQSWQTAAITEMGEVMWGGATYHNRKTLGQWWSFLLMRQEEQLKSMAGHSAGDVPVENAIRTFWKLICAEVINILSYAWYVRRTRAEDEKWFRIWSTWSYLSPFYGTEGPYDDCVWSEDANMLREVLLSWPNKSVLQSCVEDTRRPSDYWLPEHVANNPTKVSRTIGRICNHLRKLGTLLDDEIWACTFRGSGAIRQNAPWKYLLQKVRERLETVYGPLSQHDIDHVNDRVCAIDQSIMTATLSRGLICGEDCVGLGPADTQIGDEVHLLVGGKTPFVLRPREKKDGMPEPRYEILGDCYVDGWMDGDAEEMASRERRTIVLV